MASADLPTAVGPVMTTSIVPRLSSSRYTARQEPFVASAPDKQPLAIAIDLGGTQFRVAAIDAAGEMVTRAAFPTPADAEPNVLIQQMAAAVVAIREELDGRSIVALGV